MIRIYCRSKHPEFAALERLCPSCEALCSYATKRLDHCPHGAGKPTCANCKIHCYGPEQRNAIRDVMRFAGPRMLLRHPLLALYHLYDGRQK